MGTTTAPKPYDMAYPSGAPPYRVERAWTFAHREQLWQIIDSGMGGVEPGDLISKHHARDLRLAGYVTRTPRGAWVSTPNGERALRDGLLREPRAKSTAKPGVAQRSNSVPSSPSAREGT